MAQQAQQAFVQRLSHDAVPGIAGTTQHQNPQGSVGALQQRLEPDRFRTTAGFAQAVQPLVPQPGAGLLRQTTRARLAQNMGKRMREVVALEAQRVTQARAYQRSTAAIEFQQPTLVDPENPFHLKAGALQQSSPVGLPDQFDCQLYAGVQFHLHPSHVLFLSVLFR
ncbi:hypothetical protein ACTXGQ_14615 [Marinobacter sp. 1Y8]